MPMFVPWVVSLAISWGASAATAYAIGAGLYAVGSVLLYAAEAFILAKAAEALGPKPPRGAGRGYDVAITDTGADGLAIFGTVRVSGVNVIPAISGGALGRYLEQIISFAVHPVWAFGHVGIDDLVIPQNYVTTVAGNANDGLVTGIPSTAGVSKYNDKLWVRRYLGTSTQAVDWILNNRYPTTFTSDFRGRGYPYAAMTYDWADGKTYNGVPLMTFLVHGAACYDPRQDSTNGGSGSQRYNDASTWVWSDNPAIGWARLVMANFGGRADPTAINWPSVIAAANVCDALVNTPVPFTTLTDTANATHDANNNFYRLGTGGNSWAYGTYSSDGYAAVSLSATQYVLTGASAFGLNTSGALGVAGSSMAYCWDLDGINSVIRIYEGGTLQLSIGRAPTATDLFRIDYDGNCVHYYLNNILYRSATVTTPGQSLYLNASGFRQGDGVTLGVQRRYTFNARLNIAAQDWRNNARYFMDAMLGRMVRRGATYYIYAGAWTAPSFSVGKADWVSIDSIKASQPRDGGHWNTCRVWYVDPMRNWQRVECFARRSAAYKAADGGEEIAIPMEQPHCTNEYEAQRKGEFMLRRSRNQIVLAGILPPRFRYVTVGDVGSFTFPELGWSSKTLRVVTAELGPDGSIRVGLAEEQAADWNDLAISEYNAPSVSGALPVAAPTTPGSPLNFNVQVIAGTLQFSWDQPSVVPKDTVYDIWQAPTSLSDPGSKTLLWEGTALGKVLAFTTNSPYWYQVQARANSYYSAFSPTTYGVNGVAQPPGGGAGASWDATIAPSFLYKGGTSAQLTTGIAAVSVVNSNAPTYSWAAVASVGIVPTAPTARITTFTTTPNMAVDETRDGTFKCTVIDGVNSKAPTISIEFNRGTIN